MKRILAITPYGGRSGSEKVLWQALKQLPLNEFQPELYILSESDLAKDAPLPFPVHINPLGQGSWLKLADKLTRNFANIDLLENNLVKVHNKLKPDFWYINTTALYKVAALALKHNIPFIVHVHETMWLNDFIPASFYKPMMENAKLLIACSEKVKNICRVFNPNVVLLKECFDKDSIVMDDNFKNHLRHKLQIPRDAWLWAIVGRAEYNKGVDHVSGIFEELSDAGKHYIMWLGNVPGKAVDYYTSKKLERMNRSNQFHFMGERTKDYYNYLSACDGLLVLSREDSFPVCMLEAGYLKKPVLGFRSGGLTEFITPDTGALAPQNDLKELCRLMDCYASGKGNFAPEAAYTQSMKYELKIFLPKWIEILNSV